MGVDFYHCESCGDSKYSEYVDYCSKCQHRLCTRCLENGEEIVSPYAHHYNVKFNGSKEQREEFGVESKEESEYGYEIGEIIDDSGIDSKYCPFCNNSKVSDEDLFRYLLRKYELDYDQLKEEYIKSK
jgi:hypothetical protein